jgi:hypothetical protein
LAYYTQKAVVDQVTELVKTTEDALEEAKLKVEAARLGGQLAGWEQRELEEYIEDYSTVKNAIGEFDEEFSRELLSELESDLLDDMKKWKTKLDRRGDRATDRQKKEFFDAKNRYEFVSEKLGDNSPYKEQQRADAIKAAAEAALQSLSENIGGAKDLQDVMKLVATASKNTSTLPNALKESRTSDTMKAVLRIVESDKNLARKLAKEILASTNANDVANAFSSIKEIADSAGVQDPEELLKLKLVAMANKFIARADLAIGGIKLTFSDAAEAANSTADVTAAYEAAAQSAMNTIG